MKYDTIKRLVDIARELQAIHDKERLEHRETAIKIQAAEFAVHGAIRELAIIGSAFQVPS